MEVAFVLFFWYKECVQDRKGDLIMTKKQKKVLVRIILTILLVAVLEIVPVKGWLHFGLFLIPYLMISYDICVKPGREY